VKITAVVGARPNFVKIAPIMAELGERARVRATLVHTGQHYDIAMSQAFFSDLDIPTPDVNLEVRADGAVGQIADVMRRLEPVLAADRPDVVLVVGDVNSTLAATLTANKLGIAVAHVEAGLRSFDRSMPEEVNRVLTDAIADLLFTTEAAANENLAREGIPADRVHFVGNVMIDTLFRYRERAQRSRVLDALGLAPRGYAALTLHRPSNVDDAGALGGLLGAIARIQDEVPVVFPVHPRTRQRLDRMGGAAAMPRLLLVPPMSYLDFLHLMANARCVLTDSGGIQEETTALGVPCLTLRKNTERPVTITHGTNRLVGVAADDILAGWRRATRGDEAPRELPELWDGKAAGRIVQTLARVWS
jgi:UDP-N-acetylglucosamine 2-epimerase (non-hydrolysing)